MKKYLASLIILVMGFILSACQSISYGGIITTDYVLYDFAKQIVKDKMEVTLLAPIGVDFHNFEPTSNDLIGIKNAKIFFFLGFEQNVWLTDQDTLLTYLSPNAKYLNLSIVDDEHEEHDHDHASHYYTDPMVAVLMIDRMLELIKEVDPDHAIYYTENAENYINSIIETDQAFLEDLENIENKTIYFVGHHALQAFEIHYGLTIIPLEDSITPGADPTGPQVSSFILELKENHVNYLFYQETISKNVVDSIAERAGVNHISILHGFHQITQVEFENGISYLDLLNTNITNLLEAFNHE